MRFQSQFITIQLSIVIGLQILNLLSFNNAQAQTEETDSTPPEVRNCIALGGTLTQYTIEKNEALLCRFGEAGVGASALLNYKNRQAVNSIDSFLNYIAPEANDKSELAVVPTGKTPEGKTTEGLGQFEVKPNPQPGVLQPGIRLVMSRKIQISAYCRQRGGKSIQLKNSVDGSPLKACIFSDYSGIDATTLFKGPRDESNSKLVEVLRSLR